MTRNRYGVGSAPRREVQRGLCLSNPRHSFSTLRVDNMANIPAVHCPRSDAARDTIGEVGAIMLDDGRRIGAGATGNVVRQNCEDAT